MNQLYYDTYYSLDECYGRCIETKARIYLDNPIHFVRSIK